MTNEKIIGLWRRVKRLTDLSEYIDVQASAISIRKNIAFRGPNILILFCAIIIASVGLNVNSIPVIIGAMLISPLMSPIVGMGLALGTNDTDLLRHALKNLGVMVGISILASTLYFVISPLDMENPTELLARTNPTIYDVMIALFGGFAGIVETSRKEKGTVISGVAIATALMPPLCTVGYGIASLQWQFFSGAIYLFFINTVFITLAAFVGTKYLGYQRVQDTDPKMQRKRSLIVTIGLVIIIIPSIISGLTVIRENNFSRSANAFVNANKTIGKSYLYDHKIHLDTKPSSVEIYIAGEELSTDDYALLYSRAETFGISHAQLVVHQNAAKTAVSENELIRDILRTNEEQLNISKQQVEQLRQETDSLRQLLLQMQLPSEQILAEVQTQYPQVIALTLATTGSDAEAPILALLEHAPKQNLNNEDVAKLSQWLQVRLGKSVKVVAISN